MNTNFKSNIPETFSKAIKNMAEFLLRQLHHKMEKFRNIDKNLPNGRIISQHSTSDPLYQTPVDQEEDLM